MRTIKAAGLFAAMIILGAFIWWLFHQAGSAYSQYRANQATIYPSLGVVTMASEGEQYSAVAIENGKVIGLGESQTLLKTFPHARIDQRFSDAYIYPGFIDPHVHMLLSAIQYSLPMAPPWDIPLGKSTAEGLSSPTSFRQRLREIVEQTSGDDAVLIYGYHDLVHGPLTKQILDKISNERPLIIWHYSSHDFYLNSRALAWAEISPDMHSQYEGVEIDQNKQLTGRVYEDAAPYLVQKLAPILLNPFALRRGHAIFSELLAHGGVTTVSELGYGLIDKRIDDLHIALNWRSPSHSAYRLYLVPEHRGMAQRYGDEAIDQIQRWVNTLDWAPAPVLPQVKFFSDGAFYSQTMRISEPGYRAGQSAGSQGVWVTQPDKLYKTLLPYWEAGLGIRIHSNGDASQVSVLNTLARLRKISPEQRFVIEHAGVFSPQSVTRAAKLDAAISAASHYVYYLGNVFQHPLGSPLGDWILPLRSHFNAGNKVTVHSDAPLAPPLPLLAAAIHVDRSTREGSPLTAKEGLTRYQALRTITIDAAYALGKENELGSIAIGKLADFSILNENPSALEASLWSNIKVKAKVLGGQVFETQRPH